MIQKNISILLVMLFISNSLIAQTEVISKSKLSIGDKIEIESKILSEKRTLNIYLPHGYSKDSIKKYPVIYLLDGSIDEDFIHISGLVQFGSFSWINILPETIVVGISNIDRKRDFTFPTTVKEHIKEFPTTGKSEIVIEFIEKELQPFIERNYKCNTTKTLIGQSLGGLLATEILFKKPDLFTNYVIISPSLWWNEESLLAYTPTVYKTKKSIYVAVGKEGKIMEREAKALHKKIEKIKKKNTNLYFGFFKEQNHGDVLHLAAYEAFEKIFKK